MSARCPRRRLRGETTVSDRDWRIIRQSNAEVLKDGDTKAKLNADEMKTVNTLYHHWRRRVEGFARKTVKSKRTLQEKYKLKGKGADARMKILRRFQAEYPTRKSTIEAYIQQVCALDISKEHCLQQVRASSSFWTWQGPWGHIDIDNLPFEGVRDALVLRRPSPVQSAALAKMAKQMPGV